MQLTGQQTAFVDAVTRQERNVALIARAGSGKTSTILAAVDALRATSSSLAITVCAYNKAIEVEISAKLKRNGHTDWKTTGAQTAHAMGWGLVRFAFRNPKIEKNKVRELAYAIMDAVEVVPAPGQQPSRQDRDIAPTLRQYGSQVLELVSKAKQEGVGFFDDAPIASVDTWARIAEHYDINGMDETDALDAVIVAAQHLYKLSLAQTDVVDFDDMVLWPLIKNLRVKFTRDVIFIDEAQDISRARQALIRKFLTPGGQLHIIGDDRQAIYGFSGADAEALPNMIEAFDSIILPLTVTFRCPKAVVALAQQIVPDLDCPEDAPEGVVARVASTEIGRINFVPGQAILCRNTAPLVQAAYGLIRRGIAAKVEGRDIGIGLTKLARRWKVSLIEALLPRLENYRVTEMQKAVAKGSDQKAEQIADKVDTLVEICTAVQAKGQHKVEDVVDFITNLFGDDIDPKACVTLATYHRSKGREWGDVFLIEHHARCPSKAARQDWQRRQESNLAYVAFTRAMKTLTFLG
jgi:superfamily I DNA/RNA helicase